MCVHLCVLLFTLNPSPGQLNQRRLETTIRFQKHYFEDCIRVIQMARRLVKLMLYSPPSSQLLATLPLLLQCAGE